MKRFVKIDLQMSSNYSVEEIKARVDGKIEEQSQLKLPNLKSSPLFLWSREDDVVTLKYYHSYKSDLCDTMFEGRLVQGLNGCQLVGKICKPKLIWGLFFGFIALAVVILLICVISFLGQLTFDVAASGDYSMLNHLPAFLLVIPAVYVGIYFLVFDKKRLKTINDELRTFMNAYDIDVIGEELEEYERT